MEEMRVQSLAWEDPLEQEMATCSSILAWKIPWTEKPGGLQSMGLQRVGHDRACCTRAYTHTHTIFSYVKKKNEQNSMGASGWFSSFPVIYVAFAVSLYFLKSVLINFKKLLCIYNIVPL